MTALLEMNHSLNELGHAGLFIRLWDYDVITQANLGRQRFAESEVGLYKSVAIINRINRFSGTNWKAVARKFEKDNNGKFPDNVGASIYISCVDSVKARFEIADILSELGNGRAYSNRPRYWLDFGNSKHTGQVLLSTIGKIRQPNSEKYETVASLPWLRMNLANCLNSPKWMTIHRVVPLPKPWKSRTCLSIPHWCRWVVRCYGACSVTV
ncbi:ThiF family adenylyltransferase [Sphingobacterium multivorum]|nr:ThiF family adenylyltransferase [Sphingobacterium multivorum]